MFFIKLRKLFSFSSLIIYLLISTNSLATDLDLLDPGDMVYRAGFFGVASVTKVLVVRIDKGRAKVKIRDAETGMTEWVNASNLYTQNELTSARTGAAIKGVFGAANGLAEGSIRNITKGCQNDGMMNLSLGMMESFKGGDYSSVCNCFAKNIVRNESSSTIKAIEQDFEKTNTLGKEKQDRYFDPCLP